MTRLRAPVLLALPGLLLAGAAQPQAAGCSPSDASGCGPQIVAPMAPEQRFTVQSPTQPPAVRPQRQLDSVRDMFSALEACWKPPPEEQARKGTQITVRLSVKRDGDILGRPMITFRSPGLSPEQQDAYFKAVAEMLRRCLPLPLSPRLGQIVAGRPFTIRVIDNRNLRRAEYLT